MNNAKRQSKSSVKPKPPAPPKTSSKFGVIEVPKDVRVKDSAKIDGGS